MINQLQNILKDPKLQPYLYKKRIGLEKESQRVTLSGALAQTNHPKTLGSRTIHPYIQTDFSETQTELITPVFDTEKEALRFLSALNDVLLRSMPEEEMLWPLSMPPALPVDDRDIQIAKLENQGDVNYRRYLAKVYGKRKQMVSGIHYNFEFSPQLIKKMYDLSDQSLLLTEFKSEIYLKVARQYLRYRWLITYFFGASPIAEDHYFIMDRPNEPVRSIRNSSFGYTNRPEIKVSYESLDTYVNDIEHLVDTGALIEAKEFYSSVRLRGSQDLQELAKNGIQYVELRNIDLDPFSTIGINQKTLDSLHLLVLLMLWLPEEEKSVLEREQEGVLKNNTVALENPLERTIYQEEGNWLLQELDQMIDALNLSDKEKSLAEELKDQFKNPEKTLAGRYVKTLEQTALSNGEWAVSKALDYHHAAHEKPYQLAGYREMELSTQILMFDALQKGLKLEILDEEDQFLKLSRGSHIEYVKNGNMTSKDHYISPLMMENKVVTKKILATEKFSVPSGYEFSSLTEAMNYYPEFESGSIVIKPKSTNFGLGISIFKASVSHDDYQQALEMAFEHDSQVLVEEFLEGTEYRFFVLDGKTKAVLQRVPANVEGDGCHTIAELVAKKNENPLRGTNHHTPLEKIALGESEAMVLKTQNLDFSSVPTKGEHIYLRENSNVSTGGDSIDRTDDVAEGYKRIAEDAAKALGAVVCGVDMMIPNIKQESIRESKDYGIIEANFNPMMQMHIYPHQGHSRRLTRDVLDLLFPEL